MASSANIAAFNLGNFLGVWLSGLALAAGLGWTSPLWVGAGFAGLGLVVILAASAAERRAAERRAAERRAVVDGEALATPVGAPA
jgi:DHA1 family inner membrane transport protein